MCRRLLYGSAPPATSLVLEPEQGHGDPIDEVPRILQKDAAALQFPEPEIGGNVFHKLVLS